MIICPVHVNVWVFGNWQVLMYICSLFESIASVPFCDLFQMPLCLLWSPPGAFLHFGVLCCVRRHLILLYLWWSSPGACLLSGVLRDVTWCATPESTWCSRHTDITSSAPAPSSTQPSDTTIPMMMTEMLMRMVIRMVTKNSDKEWW